MIKFRLFDHKLMKPSDFLSDSLEECLKAWTQTPSDYHIQSSQNGEEWRDWTLQTVKDAVSQVLFREKIDEVRSHNVGASDYSKHKIQPWDIWMEYHLNPWDADIVKRILRTKSTDSRKLDYEKIIHICQERIRQIDEGYEF